MKYRYSWPEKIILGLVLSTLGSAVWFGYRVLEPQWQSFSYYQKLLQAPAPTTLAIPVAGVKVHQLQDTFGAARSEGRKHEGIDIFAPTGRPVISSVDGVVSNIRVDRLGGNTITVLGAGNYHHYFAHLSAYADVQVGEQVKVGTVLGYVGKTGNAKNTPAHLHYGVYTAAWQAVNPYPLLIKQQMMPKNRQP